MSEDSHKMSNGRKMSTLDVWLKNMGSYIFWPSMCLNSQLSGPDTTLYVRRIGATLFLIRVLGWPRTFEESF